MFSTTLTRKATINAIPELNEPAHTETHSLKIEFTNNIIRFTELKGYGKPQTADIHNPEVAERVAEIWQEFTDCDLGLNTAVREALDEQRKRSYELAVEFCKRPDFETSYWCGFDDSSFEYYVFSQYGRAIYRTCDDNKNSPEGAKGEFYVGVLTDIGVEPHELEEVLDWGREWGYSEDTEALLEKARTALHTWMNV